MLGDRDMEDLSKYFKKTSSKKFLFVLISIMQEVVNLITKEGRFFRVQVKSILLLGSRNLMKEKPWK